MIQNILRLCFFFIILNTYQCFSHTSDIPNYQRVCYYTEYNPVPSQINATLCTHIITGFSSVKDGLISIGSDIQRKMYKETVLLKTKYSHLKILLSIGGGGNDYGFSSAMVSLKSRTRFILSILTVLNDYDFDGLDIDWEFPVWNDNISDDKENFIAFIQEFKLGAAVYKLMKNKPLLLTVAVGAPKAIVDRAYNITEMAKYVDFINLMTYDFHDYYWYTPFTGHNSPLFKRSIEKGYLSTLNTAWSASYWNQQGMPKSKIMVGIPTYAHTYKLLDPNLHDVDSPASGLGMNDGDISFTQVCQFLSSGGTRVFDNESKVPYAFHNLDWISYEDQESILGKAKWIKKEGFGGAMTYNLNSDDWQNVCDTIPFPLHTIIYSVFTS